MGEIADDMIDGFSCSGCGIYFSASHGFPVLCNSCYSEWYLKPGKEVPKKKRDLPMATEKEASASLR